jgi:hypothetical protein
MLGQFNVQRYLTPLQQQFNGSIRLSTGVYPARNMDDLNRLSWNNGLLVLEHLDMLNDSLSRLEHVQQHVPPTETRLQQAQNHVAVLYERLNKHLQDQRKLSEAAHLLKQQTLYTPVYQDALQHTMARLRHAAVPKEMNNGTKKGPS